MSECIIQRSNGKVVQEWQNNNAAWSFFVKGMSADVNWTNVGKLSTPKKFKSKGEAEWYLAKRTERLKSKYIIDSEAQWTYEVIEVE